MPRIVIGADHGGFPLKEELKKHLLSKNLNVEDVGAHSTDPVDYPDIAFLVGAEVARNEHTLGIVIDGAGIGSCMAANKVPGVRAACYRLASCAQRNVPPSRTSSTSWPACADRAAAHGTTSKIT